MCVFFDNWLLLNQNEFFCFQILKEEMVMYSFPMVIAKNIQIIKSL